MIGFYKNTFKNLTRFNFKATLWKKKGKTVLSNILNYFLYSFNVWMYGWNEVGGLQISSNHHLKWNSKPKKVHILTFFTSIKCFTIYFSSLNQYFLLCKAHSEQIHTQIRFNHSNYQWTKWGSVCWPKIMLRVKASVWITTVMTNP